MSKRAVPPQAVFVLSHVHCPVSHVELFRDSAKWVLPRCRLREAANGQAFEHLHLKAGDAKSYEYIASSCGFEDRNVGRGVVISAGTAVNEFCWFEEWADWSGVEAHGKTEHGKLFHASMDRFIEEEWTFYQLPKERVGVARIPSAADLFNRASVRMTLRITHLKTAGEAQRSELLDHFRPGSAGDELISDDDTSGYTLLLENRSRPGEFVFLVEGSAPDLDEHLERIVASAPCSECSAVLRFGPPLWPEDMELTMADVAGADEQTLPKPSAEQGAQGIVSS
jgi:hypothetical protein